jgi:hypothetical protein
VLPPSLFPTGIRAVITRMAFVRKCPRCGLEITDRSASTCSGCGAKMMVLPRIGIWVGAIIQITLCTVFMLLFGFPKIMILVFSGFILAGSAFAAWVKPKPKQTAPVPVRPVSNPVLLKILGVLLGACSLICLALVIFGFVIFMNAWTRWHQYEGQSYHRAEFQVRHVYYQKRTKGGTDISASGMVEGHLEYLSLLPYVHSVPRSEAELESKVPTGTVISVYLFPNLKGRARVQVYDPVPPAEASHRMAVSTVKNTLLALAVMAGLLFVLTRLRALCFVEEQSVIQQVGSG